MRKRELGLISLVAGFVILERFDNRIASIHDAIAIFACSLVGLFASWSAGKSNYNFLYFTLCGLLVGFFVAVGLGVELRFTQKAAIWFMWLFYVVVFIAVGRKSGIRARST